MANGLRSKILNKFIFTPYASFIRACAKTDRDYDGVGARFALATGAADSTGLRASGGLDNSCGFGRPTARAGRLGTARAKSRFAGDPGRGKNHPADPAVVARGFGILGGSERELADVPAIAGRAVL